MTVTGDLTGNEDLIVDGRLEGTIELPQHVLTVGPRGTLNGHVLAASVIVAGRVKGDIIASGAVSLLENASVDGDITTPRLTLLEGAHCRGRACVREVLVAGSAAKTPKGRSPSAGLRERAGRS